MKVYLVILKGASAMKKVIACPCTFSSRALNVLLKLTSKRSPKTEKTEAHCRQYIQGLAAKNAQPTANPEKTVGQPVEDRSVGGMQTFVWGGSGNPEQPANTLFSRKSASDS